MLFYFCIWSDYFPSRLSPEINFFALFAQNPRNACIYALKACSELISQQRVWKVIGFPSFDTVKTTPFALCFLRDFLPNLSFSHWIYCHFADRKYFASKENQPFSRIEDVYEGIGPFWRPLGPLPSVTHLLTYLLTDGD